MRSNLFRFLAATIFVVVGFTESVYAGADVTCARADGNPRLPAILKFKILSSDSIEARAWSRADKPSPKVTLQREEIPGQPGVAMFFVGGSLTISGDAKLLITKTALTYLNVGTLLIVNRTSGDTSSYNCN